MIVEAELIGAVSEILSRLGFKDFVVRVNHRGILADILDTAGVQAELHGDALVAIDKLDKIGHEGVAKELADRGISDDASKMLLEIFEHTHRIIGEGKDVNRTIVSNLLNIVSNEVLTQIGQLLRFAGRCPIQIDPSLARGLSYYTGTIMEISVPDLAGSLGGGGRYDGLIGMFGKEQIPACGFSLGLERILVSGRCNGHDLQRRHDQRFTQTRQRTPLRRRPRHRLSRTGQVRKADEVRRRDQGSVRRCTWPVRDRVGAGEVEGYEVG
jgi:histidyl-tRNA synthetase